ncbi:MAG: VWA domain-containing protein [Muribaculaceae bacterium]|nr:VWA domain-containing protein [Muribaculaceae bacterium]
MEKTTIFNLIILDESGSMGSLTSATIEGCNSVLATARKVQQENTDSQRVLVSIYAFQSGAVPSRYIVHNDPADKVADIDGRAYRPCGCTPLYDAIGTTLTELEAVAKTHEDATGVITIITDGMENDSKRYSHKDVVSLIDRFKEMGWVVNFIGANVDVEKVADTLHISNRLQYDHSVEGISASMTKFNMEFEDYAERERRYNNVMEHPDAKLRRRKEDAKRFFSRPDKHK